MKLNFMFEKSNISHWVIRFALLESIIISIVGVFSGNLSLDVATDSKWNISRGGFCGMRSKKVNLFRKLFRI